MDPRRRILEGLLALALLLGGPPLAAAQPGPPGTPVISVGGLGPTGAAISATWAAGAGATSYRYTAGFNDGGPFPTGSTTPPAATFTMPYHGDGLAAGAWLCIESVAGAQGGTEQACGPFAMPAAPGAAPPPPAAAQRVTVSYLEPSTNDCTGLATVPCATCTPPVVACCTGIPLNPGEVVACPVPLADLAAVEIWYRLGAGPDVQGPDVPASSPIGGVARAVPFDVPAVSGTLTLWLRARNLLGLHSGPSPTVTTTLGPPTGATGLTIRHRRDLVAP